MLMIISVMVIAVIIIGVLLLFNIKSDSDKQNQVNAQQKNVEEPVEEEITLSSPLDNSDDSHIQKGLDFKGNTDSLTNNISDQAYRQALQSFRNTDNADAEKKSEEKMNNDDMFRQALQSMAKRDGDSKS